MDFLTAEIARKRKEIESTAGGTSKKFIRQRDVAEERERRYREEQAQLHAEREAKAQAKLEETLKREAQTREREARVKKEKEERLALAQSLEKVVTDEEVQNRLRELGEPRTLFAETAEERKLRLENAEMKAAVERKRLARLEAAKHDDILPVLEPIENLTPDAAELQIDLADIKNNPNKLYDQLYRYLMVMCQEWTKNMDTRDDEEKDSSEGTDALKLQQQVLEDFRPLLKSLKRKVPPPVMPR
jgi:pre-mRNA-splicing factor 18